MTPEGIQDAKEYLSILRDGKRLRNWERDLEDLLTDPQNATPVFPEIQVQRRHFANRREAGQYLQPISGTIRPQAKSSAIMPLWSWLGMYYLDAGRFCVD